SIGSNGRSSGFEMPAGREPELGGTGIAHTLARRPCAIGRRTQRNRIYSLSPELLPPGSRSVMVATSKGEAAANPRLQGDPRLVGHAPRAREEPAADRRPGDFGAAAAHSRHGGIVDGRHACPGACAPDVDIGVAGG